MTESRGQKVVDIIVQSSVESQNTYLVCYQCRRYIPLTLLWAFGTTKSFPDFAGRLSYLQVCWILPNWWTYGTKYRCTLKRAGAAGACQSQRLTTPKSAFCIVRRKICSYSGEVSISKCEQKNGKVRGVERWSRKSVEGNWYHKENWNK